MVGTAVIRSVREQITDLLRDEILCGRLPEGEHLSELKLAQRFRVGRGAVREALQQLTHEGMLVSKPNCGVRVAPPAPDAIREVVVPIRRTIETYALKSIFDGLTDADFQLWEEILLRMEAACRKGDVHGIVQQDIALHRSLLVRAGRPELLTIWQGILAMVRTHFRQAVLDYGDDLLGIHADHRGLVDTFRSGDRQTATQALEKHIW
jgi:DNA-binding GntR family transcriptional regulator